jgi:hypothetical protein
MTLDFRLQPGFARVYIAAERGVVREAFMPKYRLSSVDQDGDLQSSCIVEAENDVEAREIAEGLLAETHPAAVEVWSALRLVCRASLETSEGHPSPRLVVNAGSFGARR